MLDKILLIIFNLSFQTLRVTPLLPDPEKGVWVLHLLHTSYKNKLCCEMLAESSHKNSIYRSN